MRGHQHQPRLSSHSPAQWLCIHNPSCDLARVTLKLRVRDTVRVRGKGRGRTRGRRRGRSRVEF